MKTANSIIKPIGKDNVKTPLLKRIWSYRMIYLLLFPGLVFFAVFHYIPYIGMVMAFENFSPAKGLFHSKWVGLDNFIQLFQMSEFYKVFGFFLDYPYKVLGKMAEICYN